jgi:GMP reductase
MRDSLFTYDNICLRPKYSELPSRAKADTSTTFLGHKFKLPVVPANMQDVISWELAGALDLNEYFYIMHRFGDANRQMPPHVREFAKVRSISVGVNQASKEELMTFANEGTIPQFITIDVAHGHHYKVKEMLDFIRQMFPAKRWGKDVFGDKEYQSVRQPKIIAGNVATADGYKYLCDLGVDAVKVGIGGGSICSTRYKTGFHLPTAYSVWECATHGDRDVPIIADGGASHYGDVAKALVLGADMVMSGRWFAECIDSPARIHDGKKIYRGSTSFESKGHNNHIEGHTLAITEGCKYGERLQEIQQALQSAISYAGGDDLSAFNGVEWELLP